MRRWIYLLGLALLTLAGAALRAAWMDHPMRYDESFGFIYYILPRKLSACLSYSAPNNHILHTLLVALASAIGGDSPTVLRLPAFLAGVALIPATGHLAAVLSGRRIAGLLAAALVACSGILVEYSVNARGYSLLCLAAVGLTERTARIARDVRLTRPWIGWALVAALGMLTIPLMLYLILVLAIVIVLQAFIGPADPATRRLALRRTVATLALAAGLTILLYIPVFRFTGLEITERQPIARASPLAVYGSGIYAVVANPFVEPKTFAEAAAGLPIIAAEWAAILTRDMAWPGWLLPAAGLLGAVVVGLRRRRALYLLPLLLPAVLAGMALAQRVVPFARAWLFALPLLLAVASCGLVELAWSIPSGWRRGLSVAVIALAVAAATVHAAWRVGRLDHLVYGDVISNPSRGDICLLDARRIVTDALELADGHTDLAWNLQVPSWPPLAYYMVTLSSPSRQFVPYLDPRCRRVLAVVTTGQTLRSFLDQCPELAKEYGPMELWRRYPSADVYIASRK